MKRRGRPRGLLLAIEGIDGAGKSTVARRLRARLRREGLRVALHREPNDRELGRLAQRAGADDPGTAALLFTVDRAAARRKLARSLGGADVVLTDRSFYSTLAYQGSWLAPSHARALADLQPRVTIAPDRVVWLRIRPDVALRRVGRRRSARSPLERRATLERVATAYARMARRRGWTTLDATRPLDELVDATTDVVLSTLGRGRPRVRAP